MEIRTDMECFRVDESGYTGFDLLNADQPFQGATAIAISDDDATRLIKEHFPKLQAPELKYSSLTRRKATTLGSCRYTGISLLGINASPMSAISDFFFS